MVRLAAVVAQLGPPPPPMARRRRSRAASARAHGGSARAILEQSRNRGGARTPTRPSRRRQTAARRRRMRRRSSGLDVDAGRAQCVEEFDAFVAHGRRRRRPPSSAACRRASPPRAGWRTARCVLDRARRRAPPLKPRHRPRRQPAPSARQGRADGRRPRGRHGEQSTWCATAHPAGPVARRESAHAARLAPAESPSSTSRCRSAAGATCAFARRATARVVYVLERSSRSRVLRCEARSARDDVARHVAREVGAQDLVRCAERAFAPPLPSPTAREVARGGAAFRRRVPARTLSRRPSRATYSRSRSRRRHRASCGWNDRNRGRRSQRGRRSCIFAP